MNKIHLVQFGLVACEMRMPPGTWPEGHFWSANIADVTCDECKRNATETPLTFEILAEGRAMKCRICGEVTDEPAAIQAHACPNCKTQHDDLWPPARALLMQKAAEYGTPLKLMRTICQVVMRNGKKRWVVIHNDYDPESVGETTACGLPCRAEDVPVGTNFITILTKPK